NLNAMIVPGSGIVKEQAEAEGLDKIFIKAGFEWREPGCSMCLAMNPDKLRPEERCASTSNRNFEGRQGFKGRTHLVSPTMAAAGERARDRAGGQGKIAPQSLAAGSVAAVADRDPDVMEAQILEVQELELRTAIFFSDRISGAHRAPEFILVGNLQTWGAKLVMPGLAAFAKA